MDSSLETASFRSDEVVILSDIIQAAYCDTLFTDTWIRILGMIGQVVPCDAAGAVFANVQTGRLENRITLNLDAELVQWYDEHFAAISLIGQTAQTRGFTVWRPSEVIGKQEYEESEIRQALSKDFGLGEPVCVTCGSPPQITARFWFLREIGKVDFTDRELHILKLLQPHICSALVIARDLLDGAAYQHAFENAYRPVFICDSTGKIIHLTSRAKLFARGSGDDGEDGLAEIEAITQRMISNQEECLSAELLGQKCQMNLSTLAARNVPTTYMLAITSPEQLRQILYSFMREYGLSDREVEICTMVAQGLHNRDIVDKLFIAESTVKDHVSSIFQKLAIESRAGIAPKLLGF
jgi:DNA-binding CsgD family transcriptional regulator